MMLFGEHIKGSVLMDLSHNSIPKTRSRGWDNLSMSTVDKMCL